MFSRAKLIKEIEDNFVIDLYLTNTEENYPYLGKNYLMNILLLNSKNFLPS